MAESMADMAVAARVRVLDARGNGTGRVAEQLVHVAASAGYRAVPSGPNRFRLARTFRPKWALVLGLVFMPFLGFGLFFLLVKRTETCEAVIVDGRAGVKLHLAGSLPPRLIEALERDLARPVDATGSFEPTTTAAAAAAGPPPPPPPSPVSLLASPPGALPLRPPLPVNGVFDGPDFDATITSTRLTSLRPPSGAALRFPDGRAVTLAAGIVVGRNPDALVDRALSERVVLDDPSLSKTHASFAPSPSGAVVTDHHSTNGTFIVVAGGPKRCQPGEPVEVATGGRVLLGEVAVLVEKVGG